MRSERDILIGKLVGRKKIMLWKKYETVMTNEMIKDITDYEFLPIEELRNLVKSGRSE